MILSHRIALDPTDKQRRYFAKACGCARLVYNLALAEWGRRRLSGDTCNIYEIKKDFNEFKYEAYPFLKNLHRDCHSQPFANLQKSVKNFFNKKSDYPRFHKKGQKDSFYVSNDKMRVGAKMVRLPVIGWVRMRDKLRLKGDIASATVSRQADRWFIAIQVDVGEFSKKRTGDKIVGCDVGIISALTLSDGTKFDAPKPLKKVLRKLRRVQRKWSRQVKGGRNYKKTAKKAARIHARCANMRKDFWHKTTTQLCRENQAIAVEDLNVAGMMKNRKLSRALLDVSFGMMRPMLEYKSKIYGNQIIVVDRWFPSSKTCSCCGLKKDMPLERRIFECNSCGATLDRDVNAAINLRNKIPGASGKFMPVDRERLVKAPCEAGTTMSATRRRSRLVETQREQFGF